MMEWNGNSKYQTLRTIKLLDWDSTRPHARAIRLTLQYEVPAPLHATKIMYVHGKQQVLVKVRGSYNHRTL